MILILNQQNYETLFDHKNALLGKEKLMSDSNREMIVWTKVKNIRVIIREIFKIQLKRNAIEMNYCNCDDFPIVYAIHTITIKTMFCESHEFDNNRRFNNINIDSNYNCNHVNANVSFYQNNYFCLYEW